MTVAELVPMVLLKAKGKVSSLTNSDSAWIKILAIANMYIRQWADEPGVDWNSLYNPALSLGTVTNTDTYPIPSTVRKLSDRHGDVVRIDRIDGVGYDDYELVPADTLKRYYAGQNKEYGYGKYAAQIGSNLVFNYKFATTSPMFGGTIYAPIYTYPAQLVNDTDVVPVDIPMWLVLMSAAEFVRNDVTKVSSYPTLVAEANDLMVRMKDDNDAAVEEIELSPVGLGRTWALDD